MVIKNDIKKPENIKLLVFDIDDTLLRYSSLEQILKKAFNFYNIPYKSDYLKKDIQMIGELIKRNESELCFSFDAIVDLWKVNFEFFKECNIDPREFVKFAIDLEREHTYLISGAKELICCLYSRGYKIVSATNWLLYSQVRKLDKFDLVKYFDKIYTCEGEFSKPHENHFLRILDDYVFEPEETLVIGDSLGDVSASKYGFNSMLLDRNKKNANFYDLSTAVVTRISDTKRILKI